MSTQNETFSLDVTNEHKRNKKQTRQDQFLGKSDQRSLANTVTKIIDIDAEVNTWTQRSLAQGSR